jgi:hypothetical protein
MIFLFHPSTDFGALRLGRGGVGAVQQIPGLDQRLRDQGERRLPFDGSLAPALRLLEPAKLFSVADRLLDGPASGETLDDLLVGNVNVPGLKCYPCARLDSIAP